MNASLLVWHLACRLITIGSKVNVYGKDLIPAGNCIFAINHPTSFDPCYVYGLTNNAAILMTEFVFTLPFAGRLVNGCGFIRVPIEGTGSGSGRRAFSMALNALLTGRNLLVAPEGKMSPDSGGKAKTGTVRLSEASGKPVVPVAITHSGSVKTFKIKDQPTRYMPFGRTNIDIGVPIQFPVYGDIKHDTRLLMRSIEYLGF